MKQCICVILSMVFCMTLAGCAGQNSPKTLQTESILEQVEFTFDEKAGGYCIAKADVNIQGEIVIPELYNGKPVIRIAERAFYNCKKMTGIELPDSITNIGASAFRGCSGLIKISLPDSLEAISADCFHGCTNLKFVDIPLGVQQISERAFYECESLTEVGLPESLKKIDLSAFRRCSGLTEMRISLSVERIGEHAFYDCKKIVVYCKAEKRPQSWAENWIESGRTVYWGI